MIMDSCAVLETSSNKEALGRLGIKILYIPRGFTGQLQVLNVSVSHPFKFFIREQYESFTRGGSRHMTFSVIFLRFTLFSNWPSDSHGWPLCVVAIVGIGLVCSIITFAQTVGVRSMICTMVVQFILNVNPC